MTATRTVFHVTPAEQQWQVTRDGVPILAVDTKVEALVEARFQARQSTPSQVVVHTADGRIEDETTYPDDPFPPAV